MINNRTKLPMRRLSAERQLIAGPTQTWSYAHHAALAFFQDRLYAIWSSSRRNEDDCGQRVMLSTSTDFSHWTPPCPLLDSRPGEHSDLVLTAGGLYVHAGALRAYFGQYEYPPSCLREGPLPTGGRGMLRPEAENDPGHLHTEMGVLSTRDGEHWSAPRLLGVPVVPNHGPQATLSGRLIIAGGAMYPYTDDPDGENGFVLAGIYGDAFGDQPPYDDSAAIEKVTKARGWKAPLLCEGSFFQTDDGVIHMMLRSNSSVLWCTESRDGGASYGEPYPTEFTDDKSKFHFGRLPDGRFYAVSNPVTGGGRNPLVLSLSEDGENFDVSYILRDEPYERQYAGMYKGGLYGYPHSILAGGYLYVIYSKRKEAIEITRVPLSAL